MTPDELPVSFPQLFSPNISLLRKQQQLYSADFVKGNEAVTTVQTLQVEGFVLISV